MVRRLLQVGTLLFVLVTFLAPLLECFDRWDAPGLANDTEFGLFALVLVLCLVLLVCALLAARLLLVSFAALRTFLSAACWLSILAPAGRPMLLPPRINSPLLI